MTGQGDFPQRHADELGRLIEAGAASSVVTYIRAVTSPLERRQLFAFAQQAMSKRKDATRDLDTLVAVAHAAIEEGASQAAAETDPAEAAKRKDFVNAIAYNLAADLAECWPDDLTPRAKRHFEAGLAAAQQAVRLRDELGKPAVQRATAWWACGAHQLSLGRAAEAATSFERSLEFARRACKGAAAVAPGGDFHVILASGCLGLATKSRLFEEACTAFDATTVRPSGEGDAAENARVGAAQLRWFAQRLADPARPADLRS
jgi:hypothetical protein